MVVVGFNERVPKVALRGITEGIQSLQVRIDRLAKTSDTDQVGQRKRFFFVVLRAFADSGIAINLTDNVVVTNLAAFECDDGTLLHRMVVQRRAFRKMVLENKAKLLLLCHPVQFLSNLEAKFRIWYLSY